MRAILQLTMRSAQELDFSIVAWCQRCGVGRGIHLARYEHSEMTLLAFCRRLRCSTCGSKPHLINIDHQTRRGGKSLPVLRIGE